METKLKRHSGDKVRSQLNLDCGIEVPSQGLSGGLLLLWMQDINASLRSYSKGHIDVSVQEKDWAWRFTGIYGNPVRNLHKETWTLMRRLWDHSDLPWVLGGDFNEITDNHEKIGGIDRNEAEMRNFRDTIDDCGLMDPGFSGPMFTWYNNHVPQDLIWARLDRFLINYPMMSRSSRLSIHHLAKLASDHRPILADWKEEPPDQGKHLNGRPKRFEEVWTKYAECREIVEQVWRRENWNGRGDILEKNYDVFEPFRALE